MSDAHKFRRQSRTRRRSSGLVPWSKYHGESFEPLPRWRACGLGTGPLVVVRHSGLATGRLFMRFAMLATLAAVLWVQPAQAVTVTYGLRFEGTKYFDSRYGVYPDYQPLPIIGSFTFNTDTNLLEALRFSLIQPTPDLTADFQAAFNRHPGCDLNCVIAAMDGSGWTFDARHFGDAGGLLSFGLSRLNDGVSQELYTGRPPYNFWHRGEVFCYRRGSRTNYLGADDPRLRGHRLLAAASPRET